MKKIFLFDGACSFCTQLANDLKGRCIESEIQFQSFRYLSDQDLKHIHPNLTRDLCLGNVQYIIGTSRYPGFFAVRKISHTLRILRYFSFLLYLPLVPILGIIAMTILKRFKTYPN